MSPSRSLRTTSLARWNQTSSPGICGMLATYWRGLGLYTDSAESCARVCVCVRRGASSRGLSVGDAGQVCSGRLPLRTRGGGALPAQLPALPGCPRALSSCSVSSAMRPLLGRPMRSVLRGTGWGSLVTAGARSGAAAGAAGVGARCICLAEGRTQVREAACCPGLETARLDQHASKHSCTHSRIW